MRRIEHLRLYLPGLLLQPLDRVKVATGIGTGDAGSVSALVFLRPDVLTFWC
jgi:hypothetical protein